MACIRRTCRPSVSLRASESCTSDRVKVVRPYMIYIGGIWRYKSAVYAKHRRYIGGICYTSAVYAKWRRYIIMLNLLSMPNTNTIILLLLHAWCIAENFGEVLYDVMTSSAVAKLKIRQYVLGSDSQNLMLAKVSRYTGLQWTQLGAQLCSGTVRIYIALTAF